MRALRALLACFMASVGGTGGNLLAAGHPEPIESPRIDHLSPDTTLLGARENPRAHWEQEVTQLTAAARAAAAARRAPGGSRAGSQRGETIPPPPEAAWVLGLLHLHGVAVVLDPAAARGWFERARVLGHPLAPAGLAWCEIDGCGAPAHPAGAARWTDALRSASPGRANYLQWLAEKRMSPLQLAQPVGPQAATPLEQRQRALLQHAATAGDAQALVELGFDDISNGNRVSALAHFKAATGSPSAAHNVRILSMGQAPAVAGSGDNGTRAYQQARRYHTGDGVPANFSEALRLYRMAADAGTAQATRMLSLIYSRPGPDGQIDPAWMRQTADMDLARILPMLSPAARSEVLQRDPTPLLDWLPEQWKARWNQRD